LSTYPDCITEENLLLLKKYNVKVIELGVQSLDKQVLEKSGRFYDPEVVYKSAELIKKYKFLLGLQIMLGLPGSSKQNEFKTLEGVIRINPKYLRIYPMVVIKHTKLEEMYYKKTYQPLKVDEITDRISDMFEMLENTNIKVIRIGLHSEQDFVENCIIDTGSYHNSLGQMVKSRYIHKKILKFQKKCCKNSEIIVKYNAYSVSLLYGHKNIYKDAYNKAGFILKSDSRISKKHFIISNGLIKENIFI
jgi:histone acetyltransferase (RNA polymerase elongator complex component)